MFRFIYDILNIQCNDNLYCFVHLSLFTETYTITYLTKCYWNYGAIEPCLII